MREGRRCGVISGWTDATVSAYQLDPMVVEVAPWLFRGIPCYQDLRLEWTDWKGLLADLCDREGLFVVELDTPIGRGVTVIVNGRQVATYTEKHPEPGEEGLLDPLVATRRGTVWVLREPQQPRRAREHARGGAAGRGSGGRGRPTAHAPRRAAAGAGRPADPGHRRDRLVDDPTLAGAAGGRPGRAGPGDRTLQPLRGLRARGRPRRASWASTVLVAGMAPTLKDVAQLHLQRSSPRVESMVDEAAAEGQTLDRLLRDIRAVVIRGVMQSTIDKMADEMAAMAAAPPGR